MVRRKVWEQAGVPGESALQFFCGPWVVSPQEGWLSQPKESTPSLLQLCPCSACSNKHYWSPLQWRTAACNPRVLCTQHPRATDLSNPALLRESKCYPCISFGTGTTGGQIPTSNTACPGLLFHAQILSQPIAQQSTGIPCGYVGSSMLQGFYSKSICQGDTRWKGDLTSLGNVCEWVKTDWKRTEFQ